MTPPLVKRVLRPDIDEEIPSGEAARKPQDGLVSDANRPEVHEREATSEVQCLRFRGVSRSVSIQNTGGNTLWVSLDKERWFYIMSGTSVGGTKAAILGFWYCTQLGKTRFQVSAVAL